MLLSRNSPSIQQLAVVSAILSWAVLAEAFLFFRKKPARIRMPGTGAVAVEWIDLDLGKSIDPPRSGHVALSLDEKVYVFGGYAEENPATRYPTNDLWCFHDGKWELDQPASESQPQARLASAAVACSVEEGTKTVGILLGGWDSQVAGTGGEILKDILTLDTTATDSSWKELPIDLKEPTSRLCAVPMGSSKVLIHNHRCTDHVLLLDLETPKLTKQSVGGTPPSARGLHACVNVPGTNAMLCFGGAAQNGEMANDLFWLDTETWVWEECECQSSSSMPRPRAAPCLVAIDDHSFLLFGGACPSQEGGLHGLSDTWLLELTPKSGDNDSSSSKTLTAKWTQLLEDESPQTPPGRNAATLTPISPKSLAQLEGITTNENDTLFLLSGGWYPFRTTYADNFVLKVTKK